MNEGDVFDPAGLFLGSYTPNCLLRFKGIPYSAKCLWSRLLQFKGKNPTAWPSVETLAQEMQLSTSQIKRLMAILVEHKFIRRTLPAGQGRLAHRTTRYEFLWHECFEGAHIRSSGGGMDALSGGSIHAPSTVRESCVRDSEEGNPPTPRSLADRYWNSLGFKRAPLPEVAQLFVNLLNEGWSLADLQDFVAKGPKSCGVNTGTLTISMERWHNQRQKTQPVRSAESEQRGERRRERLGAFVKRLREAGVTDARWLKDDSVVAVRYDGHVLVIGPTGPLKGFVRVSRTSPLAFQDIADFAFIIGDTELRFEEE